MLTSFNFEFARVYKELLKRGAFLILIFLLMYSFAALLLTLSYISYHGWNDIGFVAVEHFYIKIIYNPMALFSAYNAWYVEMLNSFKDGTTNLVILLPFLGIFAMFAYILFMATKSSDAFNLWFFLSNHIAKLKDIKRMGLVGGKFMILGKYQDTYLSLNKKFSGLCIANEGLGKTSSVAIPSILHSDDANLLAVDRTGTLAQYTSGYRASISDCYFFNCDMCDNEAKGELLARWNPLDPRELPPKGEYRTRYIKSIAEYIISFEKKIEKDNYWKGLTEEALHTLLLFFMAKVEHAKANDYFLSKIIEDGRLNSDDKDLLTSYYTKMDKEYCKKALKVLKKNSLSVDDYMPIGSWGGIQEIWCGKEVSLTMFSDCFMLTYLEDKLNIADRKDIGKVLLEKFLLESEYFSYESNVAEGLKKILTLSDKQRNIVFALIAGQLSIFKNKSIRERLNGSDFTLFDILGFDAATKKNKKIRTSVYMVAKTKPGRFIMGMLVDLAIRRAITMNGDGYKNNSLLLVMDDMKLLPRFNKLVQGLNCSLLNKLYFLLLAKRLKDFEDNYSEEEIEAIVANTNYKIIMAEDNRNLSKKLGAMSRYGAKSVQIPKETIGAFLKQKSGISDSHYYTALSKKVLALRKYKIMEKWYSLILAEGNYHLPIVAKAVSFLDITFRSKSMMPTNYFLNLEQISSRKYQDICPSIVDVVTSLGLDGELGLDEVLNILEEKYSLAVAAIKKTPDEKSFYIDTLSANWSISDEDFANKKSSSSSEEKTADEDRDDWWLSDDSFAASSEILYNPFNKKL